MLLLVCCYINMKRHFGILEHSHHTSGLEPAHPHRDRNHLILKAEQLDCAVFLGGEVVLMLLGVI